MTSHFKRPFWVFPLAVAALVALCGWWANALLRETVQGQLRAELAATLRANVTALDICTTNQTKLVMVLADEPEVRARALKILDEFDQSRADTNRPPDFKLINELSDYLRPHLNKIGYGLAQLVSTSLVNVANVGRGPQPPGTPVYEEHTQKFSELFASGKPVVITPFKFKPPPARGGRGVRRGPEPGQRWPPDNNLRRGGRAMEGGPSAAELARLRRGDITLMQVAAPVRDNKGVVRGALALVINPDAEFTRILSVARSGESGETYAFDQHGLMISRSRFDDQLKKLGLLEDRTGASSALNLRLTDPGTTLPKKFSAEDPLASSRPLTRIVSDAVAGGTGVDVEPANDYRGVPVVGAWRWMPQHGFGVATQIDSTEAYQPLRVLKVVFLALFLLLIVSAIGMFLFSYVNVLSLRRLSEAELKLKQLGQYTLEEKIGEGGMGVVYRARHALLRRETAVKLLLPGRADPASVQRFEREVVLTCQLTHPNTIQVYDYGRTPEGIFYYAMEYLRGLNLHDLVAGFGLQGEARVVHILTQVCDSLAEAHALGLVHRDIKPANVFLCQRGGMADCVKVLDFGLVREYRGMGRDDLNITAEKDLVGTPSFMAPEAID